MSNLVSLNNFIFDKLDTEQKELAKELYSLSIQDTLLFDKIYYNTTVNNRNVTFYETKEILRLRSLRQIYKKRK